MQLFPRRRAELSFKPGAEGEIGKAERRTGEFRRRTQSLHPGPRRPWPLEAHGRAVEHPQAADRETLQRESRRQSRHAGPDDSDIQYRPVFGMRARLQPVLRGWQREQVEIAPEARLKLGQ